MRLGQKKKKLFPVTWLKKLGQVGRVISLLHFHILILLQVIFVPSIKLSNTFVSQIIKISFISINYPLRIKLEPSKDMKLH